MKTCKYPNCGKWTDNELDIYGVAVCEEHQEIANFILELIEGYANLNREREVGD